MYDIIWIHTTSHPIFMISHHGMNFTHTVFMSSRPGYLSSHPLQLSYDLQCIENTTSAICVISNPLYVWHHMNSMWHHNNSLRHHKTVFMTSQPHYSWHHPHCIWYHIHTTCDLTALWLWKNTYYVFYIILRVYDISHDEWMTTPRLNLTWYRKYLCNQTHLTDDITSYVRMKSHPLHARHHRHFIWHHIHSCWQHTIVCMSRHTLCLWNRMHYKCCLACCVYDYPTSIPGLKPVKTAISSTLYVITPSRSKTSHLLCKASQMAYVCH